MSEHEHEQPVQVLFLVGSGDPLELITKLEQREKERAQPSSSTTPDDEDET